MNYTFDQLTDLAEQSLKVIAGLDEDGEEIAREAIFAGEPDLAVAEALDIAVDHPELYARFPQGVKDLAKDPEYEVIQPYAEQLLR